MDGYKFHHAVGPSRRNSRRGLENQSARNESLVVTPAQAKVQIIKSPPAPLCQRGASKTSLWQREVWRDFP